MMKKYATVNNLLDSKNTLPKKKKNYFMVTEWDTKEIAEALINMSLKYLNKIEYKEFYGGIWLKKGKEKNCPNVNNNTIKSNNLTAFIIEDILSYDYANDRASIIEKWALIAQYCKNMKDQEDCFAIYGALTSSITKDLTETLKLLKNNTKKIINELSEYCSFSCNYKVFREEIKNIKDDEFYIPFFGMILRDIAYNEEKEKYPKGNMINFEKIERVQNNLDSFFLFKNRVHETKIEPDSKLSFFEHLETKSFTELEKLAEQLEPKFKLKTIQREKRLTAIDKKYFLNDMKRLSCRGAMMFPKI
jgi:hypothetical protein